MMRPDDALRLGWGQVLPPGANSALPKERRRTRKLFAEAVEMLLALQLSKTALA